MSRKPLPAQPKSKKKKKGVVDIEEELMVQAALQK
jgi:hypothetical protein